jgi:hypothetical protein
VSDEVSLREVIKGSLMVSVGVPFSSVWLVWLVGGLVDRGSELVSGGRQGVDGYR